MISLTCIIVVPTMEFVVMHRLIGTGIWIEHDHRQSQKNKGTKN